MTHIILNFHGVGEPHPHVDPSEARYWLSLQAYRRALDAIQEVTSHTGQSVSITFDDGNLSDLTLALPELLKRDMQAAFFVCSGRIGLDHYLDGPALQELLQSGMEIGSHGVDHVNLRHTSQADLAREAGTSRKVLEDVCQRTVDTFAIPFGSYDRRVLGALRREKYRTVFTSDGGRASSQAWMQARQTLQFDWEDGQAIQKNLHKPALQDRVKRLLLKCYKSWR